MAKIGKKGIFGIIGGVLLITASIVCTALVKGKDNDGEGEITAEHEELESAETEVEEEAE